MENPISPEMFEVYDEHGNKVGLAPRAICHGDPRLLHRTAHVIVFNDRRELLLQKRSAQKDIQPGKWDTAVGGHLAPGETWEQAAEREMEEELGVAPVTPLHFLLTAKIRNAIEAEDVGVFTTVHNGPFSPPPSEVADLRFWSVSQIRKAQGTGAFTPSLESELTQLFAAGLLVD